MDASPILKGLNSAQKAAVTSPESVIQILAPPGSGKTKTLTSRVAYLLFHYGYKPWNTICLTFTIKSAREMKERISRLIGNGLESKIILGTFHSVCLRYLRTYGHLIGLRKGFGIADSSDSQAILNRIIKRQKLNIEPKVARSRISSSKAKGITCEQLQLAGKKNVDQQEFVSVFLAYEDHLSISNLLDYDDLLLRCVDLLNRHPECVSNVEAVLIDEFQDTNHVQFDLMRLFATSRKRITTVGDPDQSIYGWRSAEVKNLRRMQTLYPDTLVVHLEENYRSSGAILLAALEVIQQDETRPSKPLLPTHCPGSQPVLRKLPSAAVEAKWIVTEITRCMALTGGDVLRYSDFSILLRSASLSRHIESAMGKVGMPYRMVGGLRFFDRSEIKIVLDYLRAVDQPDNSDALSRIINVPSRRIGDGTIKDLLEESSSRGVILWNLIRDIVQGQTKPKTKLSKVAEQGLGAFYNIIYTSRRRLLDAETALHPHQLLELIMKKIEFRAYLEKAHPEDHENRWANIEELLTLAHSSAEDEAEDVLPEVTDVQQEAPNISGEALSRFLSNVALSTELQKDEDSPDEEKGRIVISTIHAAKGLEWPVVFVPSVYQGSIPHSRAEDCDEERRLLYVAMTRAQALLFMSYPIKNSHGEETILCPFLSPSNVKQYLSKKGPSFCGQTVGDICRMLDRSYPTQDALLQGMKGLQSIEDDQWPIDGTINPESAEVLWDPECRSYSDDEHVPKRRRFALDESRGHPKIEESDGQTNTNNPRGGFTSAASHLQTMNEEAARRPQTLKSSISTSTKSNASKSTKSQGTLNAFFRPRSANTTIEPKQVNSKANHLSKPLPSTTYEKLAFEMNAKHDGSMRSISGTSHDALENEPWRTKSTTPLFSRQPMSTIPQDMTGHAIRTSAIMKRPARMLLEADEKESSASGGRVLPNKENIPDDRRAQTSETGSFDRKTTRTSACNTLPSSTFHRTSTDLIQSRNTIPKKTLGVRRSMVGWSARGSHRLTTSRNSPADRDPAT